ncbi:MAG: hypothetical protein AAF669_05945 [Pseudomonadota bacterium]
MAHKLFCPTGQQAGPGSDDWQVGEARMNVGTVRLNSEKKASGLFIWVSWLLAEGSSTDASSIVMIARILSTIDVSSNASP